MIRIAVASGKGGTGKTMVATSLAACLSEQYAIQFLDCDVEAPNAHLFLKPKIESILAAEIMVPQINKEICTACGMCVAVCEFHALAQIADTIMVFPQLCHGCGSCFHNCPVSAITEVPRQIGNIQIGVARKKIRFLSGDLTISEPMPTPIIRQLKVLKGGESDVMIMDSPPGASCSVVATVHDADFVILVTEPTPFGLHDLKQMFGVLEKTGIPGGVIINRDGIGNMVVEDFLENTNYPVMMKIPYRIEIAAGLAKGEILTDFFPEFKAGFLSLFEDIVPSMTENKQAAK